MFVDLESQRLKFSFKNQYIFLIVINKSKVRKNYNKL